MTGVQTCALPICLVGGGITYDVVTAKPGSKRTAFFGDVAALGLLYKGGRTVAKGSRASIVSESEADIALLRKQGEFSLAGQQFSKIKVGEKAFDVETRFSKRGQDGSVQGKFATVSKDLVVGGTERGSVGDFSYEALYDVKTFKNKNPSRVRQLFGAEKGLSIAKEETFLASVETRPLMKFKDGTEVTAFDSTLLKNVVSRKGTELSPVMREKGNILSKPLMKTSEFSLFDVTVRSRAQNIKGGKFNIIAEKESIQVQKQTDFNPFEFIKGKKGQFRGRATITKPKSEQELFSVNTLKESKKLFMKNLENVEFSKTKFRAGIIPAAALSLRSRSEGRAKTKNSFFVNDFHTKIGKEKIFSSITPLERQGTRTLTTPKISVARKARLDIAQPPLPKIAQDFLFSAPPNPLPPVFVPPPLKTPKVPGGFPFSFPGGAFPKSFFPRFKSARQKKRYIPSVRADRKSTRLNSSHIPLSRMPSSA